MSQTAENETIANWVADFFLADAARAFPAAAHADLAAAATLCWQAACAVRGVAPGAIGEADLRSAVIGSLAPSRLAPGVAERIPAFLRAFFDFQATQGRVGASLGRFAAALQGGFHAERQARGMAGAAPFARPASKIGRNDPCLCGSGRKFKHCCLR